MATHQYTTATPRVGKIAGAILKHATPIEVLGIAGNQHKIGPNQSDTVIFRRYVPFGGTSSTTPAGVNKLLPINRWTVTADAHRTSEGVTPEADVLTPQDISVQVNQYSCLYMYTDKVAMLYEDNIPDAMKKEAGERMGLVRETVRYGALKGCTNKFYAGGTSRATVDEPLSKNILSKVTRSIMANRGKMVTQVLSAGPNYGTTPVEAAMLVFAHTDMEYDIREIPGFRETAGYAQRKIVHEMELGSVDRYRFVVSPELSSIIDAGAAVGATGCVSTGTANIDVYPAIVVADDAWGDVALRGSNSFSVSHIPHGQRDKSDPLGQRGYIGCIFWSAAFIQNDGWMAVIEAGVTDLG